MLDAQEGIPIKMDTTWTDIFWKNQTADGKIDDIYFAFLNRFFLNEFICKKKNKDEYAIVANKIEADSTFKLLLLYGVESDYSKVTYQSFEEYKSCITDTTLQSLNATLNNFAKFVKDQRLDTVNKLFQPNWDTTNFDFIPSYKEDGSITTLTSSSQRIVFYAICMYFEQNEYDETSFKHWMRVVWNLAENDSAGWIGCLRLIDELSENSHDIYTFLAEKCSITEGKINGITSQANREQVKEEIEKAKQILADDKNPRDYSGDMQEFQGKKWEEVIIIAEKYAFFKGAIRFLFHDGEAKPNWDDFGTKLRNTQNYFDKELNYTKDSFLLRNFISHFDKWEQFWGFSFDNSDATWKTLLTNSKWAAPIHQLLTQKNSKLALLEKFSQEIIEQQVQEDLVKTNLLDKIIDKKCVLNWRYNNYALYFYKAQAPYNKFVIANPRNAILSACYEKVEEGKTLSNGKITSDQKIEGCDFFWGWDIKFTYKKDGIDYYFEWNTDGNIYLMDDKWNRIKNGNEDVKTSTTNITKDSLLHELTQLANQSDPL